MGESRKNGVYIGSWTNGLNIACKIEKAVFTIKNLDFWDYSFRSIIQIAIPDRQSLKIEMPDNQMGIF